MKSATQSPVLRVSTTGQTTDNQLTEIKAASVQVEKHRIMTETISGSTAMAQRLGFTKLVGRMEAGDVLIVAKLDRLGRDALDVSTTVKQLGEQGVGVHCLAQGRVDLTSSAGTMTMNVLNAVAQFERDLLIDRTQAGMMRAKDADNKLGRPSRLSDEEKQRVLNALAAGESISAVAKRLATSRQTVMRVRDANL